jgi:hypothetical protein
MAGWGHSPELRVGRWTGFSYLTFREGLIGLTIDRAIHCSQPTHEVTNRQVATHSTRHPLD